MDLETVIQREVRKRKISYINVYIRNLENGIDDLICLQCRRIGFNSWVGKVDQMPRSYFLTVEF